MGILGIENRTENWKTVEHFYGLSDAAKARLVRRITGTREADSNNIEIQLFWYGFRDYIAAYEEKGKTPPTREQVAKDYNKLFRDLGKNVKEFQSQKYPYRFPDLKCHNYNASKENEQQLFDNLRHTEVDIVIQSGDLILLGEAKDESPFGADSRYVLVHQLIRQHVMTRILLDICDVDKKICHFVVGDPKKKDSIKNTLQVKFMKQQGWLNLDNVLSWCDIKELVQASSSSRRC